MPKPDAIRSLRDLRAGINVLIYGDNGVGKTPVIGTSPECLILNADPPDSVLSALVAGSTADVWKINNWTEADEAHEYLRHSRHGYHWVWLDSIGGMQFGGLDGIMEDLVIAKPHRDRYVPDQHEYLQNMNRLRTWVRDMSSLPFNFGITATPFRWTPDDETDEMVWPWVQGKGMPADICGFMNIIGFLRIREQSGKTQQVLYTSKLPTYYARDRFSALPPAMANPTIPKIEKAVMDKVGGSTKGTKKSIIVKPGVKAAPPPPRPLVKKTIPAKK